MIKQRIKSRADWFLKASAHHLTMRIAYRYAKVFPMYFVVGFPRSGTSWLSDLIADYYNLPRPKDYYLPIAFASVLHTHSKPNKRMKNIFYIYRDGRDAYTSYYFYEKRYVRENPESFYSQQFKKLWGNRMMDPVYEKENFLKYMDWAFKNKVIWSDHIRMWLKASITNKEIVMISYEQLLANTYWNLHHSIMQLDNSVNKDVLRDIIDKNSFAKQMARPKEQHKTPLRKGQKNSWTEVFSPHSVERFNEACGDMLIELGYVENLNWFEESNASLKTSE